MMKSFSVSGVWVTLEGAPVPPSLSVMPKYGFVIGCKQVIAWFWQLLLECQQGFSKKSTRMRLQGQVVLKSHHLHLLIRY